LQIRPDILEVVKRPVGRLLTGDVIGAAKLEGHQNGPEVNADVEHDEGNERDSHNAIHEDSLLQYVPFLVCQTH